MNKKTEDKTKKAKSALITRTIIFALIVLALCSTFFFKEKVENLVNYNLNKNALSTEIDENGLKAHFIDVGQGSAALIQFPTGETMIVDCGHYKSSSFDKFKDYLGKFNFKKENNEQVIDYLVLTHPDADHIGGATYVFENYLVKNCYLPQIYYYNTESPEDIPWAIPPSAPTCSDETYRKVITSLDNEVSSFGCQKVYANEHIRIRSSSYNEESANSSNEMWAVNFFAPITGKQYISKGEAITNEYSPIIIVEYMGRKIMLTGDGSKKLETDFVSKAQENGYASFSETYFDVDILQIAHHGSKYSSSENFLNLVKPEYAIISVGKNSYGHPSQEAIDRLNNAGVTTNSIYRTDNNGNILVGVSTVGKLSLVANHVQYTTYKFELWQIVLIGVGASAIIIYSPYLIKFFNVKKKGGKKAKK